MSEMPTWVVGWPCTPAEIERRWAVVNSHGAPPADASTPYGRYLLSAHWRWFRGKVLVMADSTCARCGGLARHVHHKTYERKGCELLTDVEPICESCHDLEHGTTTFGIEEKPRDKFAARRAASVKRAKFQLGVSDRRRDDEDFDT